MGPVALFDKSFLQSLSVDESVWFDHFYTANICPMFYVETLADLDKTMSRGRSAEQVVGNLAEKCPQMSGAPNIYHCDLILGDLLGQTISMANKPIVSGGRPLVYQGRKGVSFDISPEAQAFNRWQDGGYLEIERDFAKAWRENLKCMSFENSPVYAKRLGIDILICKNLNDAAAIANQVVINSDKPYDLIGFVLEALNIPRKYHQEIVYKFKAAGFPMLYSYAPYVAHVVRVEVFFHICVSRGFISAERASNKIDIAYLYYLPFCNIFISGDKLHKNSTKLFLRKNQRFIWGPDLKADLKRLNEYYSKMSNDAKDMGVMSFASLPPTDEDFLTTDIWDIVFKNWRDKSGNMAPFSDEANKKIINYVKGFTDAPTLPPNLVPDPNDDLKNMALKRSIRKKKGSWYQVPKNLPKT